MAVLDFRCIGDLSTGTAYRGIRTHSNAAPPWYPSTAAEVSAREMNGVEIFWYVNTTSNTSRYIVSVRDGTTTILRLWFSSAGFIQWRLRDRNNTVDINLTVALSPTVGVWYHSILTTDATSWRAYHGRVGRTVGGVVSTADTMPYPNTTTAVFGAGGPALLGMRNANTAQTRACLGSNMLAGTPPAPEAANNHVGGMAEFRCWKNSASIGLALEPDGYQDLRDEFIDGVMFPNLLHCFRLNEIAGTTVANYDDVGIKDARFTVQVAGGGFASSPMPNGVIVARAQFGSYKVSSSLFASKLGDYGVEVVPRPTVTRIGTYKVSSNPTASVSGDYGVLSTGTKSVTGDYSILRVTSASQFGTYAIASVAAPDTITKTGAYKVTSSPTISKSGTYEITSMPQKVVVGTYKVAASPTPFFARLGSYKVQATGTEIAKLGTYGISGTASISKSGSYRIAGQSTVTYIARAGRYTIHNPDSLAELLFRKQAELRSRTR